MDRKKLKLLDYVGMLLSVAVGIVFLTYSFLQDWANNLIVDLPPLFWLLFFAFFGGVYVTVISREITAWRAEGLTGIERGGAPLLAVGVFVLLVSLLGAWNGATMILISLGVMNLIWGGSMVIRKSMRESNSTNSQAAQQQN